MRSHAPHRHAEVALGLVLVAALGGAAWLVLPGPRGDGPGARVAPLVDPRAAAPSPAPEAAPPTPLPTTSTASGEGAAALGDPALAWNEEGYHLLEQGDLAGAAERFEAAAELWPEVDVYANNLAEALFRLARSEWEEAPDDAILTLERALEVLRDDDRRRELSPLLERWRRTRAAEDGFWTESSPYFSVSFDGTRSDLMDNVHGVLADLDRTYGEYVELFGAGPVDPGAAGRAATKLRVVFYRRATFDQVTGLGDWAGGLFDGTIRVPIESLGDERERLGAVLRHELMHAFVQYHSGSRAPAWLNEGLAQWIERPGDGRELDLALARGRLRGAELFPLAGLRGTLAAWSDREAITRAYAQALLLVDHLVRSKGEALVFAMVRASKEHGAEGPERHFLLQFPGYPLEEFAQTIPR